MPSSPHLRRLLNVLASLAMAASVSAAPADRAELPEHRYRVTVADDLDTLTVRAEVPGAKAMRTRDPRGVDALRLRRTCAGDPVRIVRGTLVVPARADGCIEYTVDLAAIDGRDGWDRISLADDVRWTSPRRWLWRAADGAGQEVVVDFVLPEGVAVSLPWRPTVEGSTRYRVPPSPGSDAAISVFGRFASPAIPGAPVRCVLLPAATGADETRKLTAWLTDAVAQVSSPYGRFPNPNAQIVVVPVAADGGRGSPVPWAHVVRDGGEAVQLFVEQGRTLADLTGDWTATHEFAHLMLPYIDSDEKWISEGFASYYQNLLMARAGHYTPREAIEKLAASFAMAAAQTPGLTPGEAVAAGMREARMAIYWTGAALAMMIDIELRTASGGRVSLDSVLGELERCCLPAGRTWRARRLFERLDGLAGSQIPSRRFEAVATTRGMPDLDAYWRRLGVRFEGSRVVLERSDGTGLRAALFGRGR